MATAAHRHHRSPADPLQPTPHARRTPQRSRRNRLALIAVGVVCSLAVLTLLFAHLVVGTSPVPTVLFARPLPADLFIQSVTRDDGMLGWHQLCPSMQAQLTESALVQAAQAEKAALARQDVTLTAGFVSTHAQAAGGQARQYLLTAHWPDGSTQMRTYTIYTQASGCVADIHIQ